MGSRSRIPAIVALALLAGACADERPRPAPGPAPSPALVFRAPASRAGHLRLVADTLRFLACGADGPGLALEDRPDGEGARLVREFGGGPDGIVALVRLDGARLAEIRHAGPEGAPCDRLPPEGDVEANGEEPFWSLRVEGARATFRTPEELDGVPYEGGAWTQPAPRRWRFTAHRAAGGATPALVLDLVEERCADSMSGARFPYRATLVRDGERMDGCALEGRNAVGSTGEAPAP